MPDLQTSLDLCTYCPRLCSHTCPVSLAEARETVTPQAKMAAFGRSRRDGDVPSLPVYACTGCGACTQACLHRVQPGLDLMQGRALLEQRGAGHPALHDLARRHREHTARAAGAVQAAIPEERRQGTGPLGYLPACQGGRAGDGRTGGPAEEAVLALRVLDAATGDGPSAMIAAKSGCGGYPLYAAGLAEQFRLHAEGLAREVVGHDTLVLGCASCTWLMRTQYREHGVPLRPAVRHISEFLAGALDRLPILRKLPRAVYHDPCYLGRHLHIYDEPRQIMGRAVEHPAEFLLQRGEAACSGGGGLLPQTAPQTASAIAVERLSELDEDKIVVTGCATCERQFNQAGSPRGIRAMGLLQLLSEAMGGTA